MRIPKEIENYLVRDEIIEKEFYLRGRFALTGYKVYASNKRLFIMRANSIKDIDYNHISSIEVKEEGSWPAAIVGLMSLVAGVAVLGAGLMYWWAWALVGCGIILMILGVIRTQFIKLFVVGHTGPERLSGHRSGLDSLFKIVREKRV